MNPEDKDFTVMSVQVSNDDKTVVHYMLDKHDGEFSSMARTTAYTCTAMVELLLKSPLKFFGVYPPEFIGTNKKSYKFIIEYLKERNVIWTRNVIGDEEPETDDTEDYEGQFDDWKNETPYVSDDFTIGPDGAFEMTEEIIESFTEDVEEDVEEMEVDVEEDLETEEDVEETEEDLPTEEE